MLPEIRSATALDADAIAAVHVAAWRAAYRDTLTVEVLARVTVEARAAQWRERLETPTPPAEAAVRTWLARADTGAGPATVAFASAGPSRDGDASRCTELYAMYVAPAHWRQGIGRALFERCLEHAHAAKTRELSLWVVESNTRARTFYEARGMVADGRKLVKSSFGARLPEVRYRLDLTAPSKRT